MKIKFNGISERTSSGCVPCGQKSKGGYKLSTVKSFILPSGAVKTFRAGQVVDVQPNDADFLKLYGTVKIGDEEKPVFEVV